MGMITANVGEDDGSGAGESGGDSPSGSSSGNSGLIRNHGHKAATPSAAARTKDQVKRRQSADATATKPKPKPRSEAKTARKVKLQHLDSKTTTMPRHFGYGTIKSSTVDLPGDATSWKSNVEKWNLETLSPRVGSRIKKQFNGPNRQACSKATLHFGSEESGDDSETSSSSYSSSSSNSPTSAVAIRIRSSSFSAADRWEAQVQQAKTHKSRNVAEELPLLQYTRDSETDIESGILLEEEETDTLPEIKTEILKLITLANPVIFTYVLEFFPALVSMTLVGHLDSPLTKQYLDGVALSTMVLNLTAIGVGFGLATAMDTLCSQAYGAGKPKKLGIYLQSGLIVLGVVMIPVFFINWYTEALLLMIGQHAQVAAFAGRFSQILLPGIPAMYVYEMLKKVMQAQNVVLPMVYIAVISNVLNLVLGVYLTFYTSLGFDGTAIARLLSEMALPLCLIPYFLRNPHIPAEWWPGWRTKEALNHLGIFLKLGIPGAVMLLFEWVSFEIMAAVIGWLPDSVVAISVHSVLVNVSTFAYNFFLGISVAANVLVGTYLGRNKPHHAKMASTLGMMLSITLSAALVVLIIATRYYIPEIFINDAVSIELAGHAMLFLMPYQMCDAVNAVMQGVLRGTGRLSLGAYINLVAYFVLGLPIGAYLAFGMDMGVEGMWLGLTGGIFFGCVVSFVKICETDWKVMADDARVRTS
ncbi:Multidrug/Oligosaccharidyl-lipid/Polysaccharide (MOP) Flippase Superfamily [Phytophthora infestans T30-4]|uniref:Multidrug/Oligosaccharidyl-lipid/Polysaccharide (MOP) Flippase Superfamily n=2 Tax=Phytophthora infestans TaxID=4787 RepID=D0NQU2_PHYIT|nr:Multidrug/Oligosaccharidyl-lipid/Polysaccharide (MOP) Flippase Superfamily [Phytophthora infestans T30-4]EEY63040.1 Multidrug/Oligosaccharidyl-lipid/Polysaccharide (MOP) Flippase Superfamily [Phytophthora infestans T30-4]KAF4138469.1 MatE [Phytophthora infestans]|eukprot:XP_002898563.1 Multidrug/Oligosaccharidyl-lipid/Polysaccharide (MOP) Flippase Superfamily [Phytophthora infestans T30-4]